MSYILLLIINLIVIFIAWVILYSKIKKNSIPSRIEEYTREVERLIIELNRALEDVVSISEEKIEELKSLIKRAEKVVKKSNKKTKKTPVVKPETSSGKKEGLEKDIKGYVAINGSKNKKESEIKLDKGSLDKRSLIEKTRHLVTMGYSRDEIAKVLGITPVEVDFLKSLIIRKT